MLVKIMLTPKQIHPQPSSTFVHSFSINTFALLYFFQIFKPRKPLFNHTPHTRIRDFKEAGLERLD